MCYFLSFFIYRKSVLSEVFLFFHTEDPTSMEYPTVDPSNEGDKKQLVYTNNYVGFIYCGYFLYNICGPIYATSPLYMLHQHYGQM